MNIKKMHRTEGVSFENPSDTLAKLFEAIPQDIPIAKNRYPKKGFKTLRK
jgi:hypothetical protein